MQIFKDPLELELQACEPPEVGTELGSSGGARNALNSPVPFGQCFITVAGKHLNLIHEVIPAGGYGHDS